MLIIGVEDPERPASPTSPTAMPSGLRKTNLPCRASCPAGACGRSRRHRLDARGSQGQLRAINPESGSSAWRPTPARRRTQVRMVRSQHHLHQRRLTPSASRVGSLTPEPPAGCSTGRVSPGGRHDPACPPNSRFTFPWQQAHRCRELGGSAGRADLRPLFGSRRSKVIPLVSSVTHGVFSARRMSTETTAASRQGRRGRAIIMSFCGYNMGDYFAHCRHASSGSRGRRACSASTGSPRRTAIFCGLGGLRRQRARAQWMVERIRARHRVDETPIG